MAQALVEAGAKVVIVGRHQEKAEAIAAEIRSTDRQVIGLGCDVTRKEDIERLQADITARFGDVHILVNAAGGNSPGATTSQEQPFFALESEAINQVFALNFTSLLLTCQVFGRGMAERGQGCIANIASMSGLRSLTRVPAYSAAKAAVVNFTQWLAVHMAQEYSPHIRVNAIAPGFFMTEQNRFLLTDAASGKMTSRGQAIIDHTPMGRLGKPDDLVGTLLWLVSPASAFVTGVVVPVDGGFSAFGGV
jgi:NAD(P)-dependent dehydrogenase (short-subunit alcohol dehydrogenase family)